MPTDLLFSSSALLWAGGCAVAILMLMGTVGRRRMSLVEVLRKFVDVTQSTPTKPPADKSSDPTAPPQSDPPKPKS